MTTCIHYSRPTSGQNEGEIFGLDVAVTNFLSAYFRHSQNKTFICRPTDMPSFDHFKALAQAEGIEAETQCIGLDPRHPQHNLEKITCLFRPDPLIGDLMWQRQQVQGRGFSSCGLVHTMSGERIARAVGDLCVAPSDGTDALICPSEAIRDAVQNLWHTYAEYLNYHFGATYRCPVQTPVIPLGIDTAKFEQLTTADKRAAQRQALNAASDEIIILCVGRLSFATKFHPLALWQAAERAALQTGRKVRLVMYGYFKPKDMEPHFRNLAAEIAKTVSIEFILNNDTRFPDGLWAGADIFTSLSDNVQESFGLTPIEAMACGLPSVITDWNGYRGGVRHGIDGFLIPTVTPPPSAGMAIAESYYNEGNYGVALMGAAQSTAVDLDLCTAAFCVLIEDEALRQRMSDSARTRARETYDWKHIIAAYENLWGDLAQQRQSQPIRHGIPKDWQAFHPAYPNPLHMFQGFPTRHLAPHDRLSVRMNKDEIVALIAHEMNYFVPHLLVDRNSMLNLIDSIRTAGSAYIQDILAAFPATEHNRIYRCLGWMLKHGVCGIEQGTTA